MNAKFFKTTLFSIALFVVFIFYSCKKKEAERNTVTLGAGVTFNGYTYTTVVLGNGQEWMAENLRTNTYRNGDLIPNVTDDDQWGNLTTGAWAHYNNDSNNGTTYGKLYNWYAVNDPRGLAPKGWHVPTDAEWKILTDYLGGESNAGGVMKSLQYWESPNTDATNESGFSGLPAGNRYPSGNFLDIGDYGVWWSSTEEEFNTNTAWNRTLGYNTDNVFRNYYTKEYGFSVRCLRD
jgi:uncharacterized protein (TIGR02145 family)